MDDKLDSAALVGGGGVDVEVVVVVLVAAVVAVSVESFFCGVATVGILRVATNFCCFES